MDILSVLQHIFMFAVIFSTRMPSTVRATASRGRPPPSPIRCEVTGSRWVRVNDKSSNRHKGVLTSIFIAVSCVLLLPSQKVLEWTNSGSPATYPQCNTPVCLQSYWVGWREGWGKWWGGKGGWREGGGLDVHYNELMCKWLKKREL